MVQGLPILPKESVIGEGEQWLIPEAVAIGKERIPIPFGEDLEKTAHLYLCMELPLIMAGTRANPNKESERLFHNQIILYRFYPFDTLGNFTCFIDGLLRIDEAAQLNGALVSFDADVK
jgi:hypothetical protein